MFHLHEDPSAKGFYMYQYGLEDRQVPLMLKRRLSRIRASAPKLLVKPFQEYVGLKGSKIYTKFRTGEARYLAFVMEKP